jgi:hypothetical protein
MSENMVEIGGATSEPQEGDALSGADYFEAHESYDSDSQEQNTEQDTESEEKPNTEDGKEKEVEKPVELTPQEKFLQEHKIDVGDLKDNEAVQNLINKAYENQNALTENQRTQKMAQDALEKKQAEAQAQKVIDSESEEVEKPLSPLETVDTQFQSTSEALSKILGVENLDALRGQTIDGDQIWALMQSEYDKEYRQANINQAQWVQDQKDLKAGNETVSQKLEQEFKDIQVSAQGKFAEAKAAFPQLEEAFKGSGQAEFIDGLCNQLNTPVEYLMNDSGIFNFCVEAAKNWQTVQGLPERDSKIKGDLEKNIVKLKKAETVSKSDPLPDDHAIGTMWNLRKPGVDILK